ncbi:MAG: hypothetical protein II953_01475, partial [Clostridia bacterium]|nr:hypothetical protein [Clostridia bacterium]
MLNELLKERDLPELLTMSDGSPVTAEKWPERRKELLRLLEEGEYGKFPEKLGETRYTEKRRDRTCAGVAVTRQIDVTFPAPDGQDFTFPAMLHVPDSATAENPAPAFVYISFGFPYYTPLEELMDEGVVIAEFCMNS